MDTQLAQPCWQIRRIMHTVAIPLRDRERIDPFRAACYLADLSMLAACSTIFSACSLALLNTP